MDRRVIAAVISVAAMLALAPAARGEDPLHVPWSSLLPALPTSYLPSTESDCLRGKTNCVDGVIREMDRRFEDLAESCDHDAIFALAYLRTTEEYRRTIEDDAFFEDTAFVNHEDAVFAERYFSAHDAWTSEARDSTPAAWKIAFDAAERRAVSATGNLVLGMNAHIQRDLPFVLAGIGLVKPDGTTRKTDHERVNIFLNRVPDDLIPELAARFDPTIDDGDAPTQIDEIAKFQSVAAWRETAWRNAERLVSAPTDAARALVVADIEAYAASQAILLRQATAYGLGSDSEARDQYCVAKAY